MGERKNSEWVGSGGGREREAERGRVDGGKRKGQRGYNERMGSRKAKGPGGVAGPSGMRRRWCRDLSSEVVVNMEGRRP